MQERRYMVAAPTVQRQHEPLALIGPEIDRRPTQKIP